MPFTAIPHSSRLFLDFLFQYEKVERFYAHRPHAQAVLEYARRLEFPAERRARVADVLEKQNRRWGASAAALASIEKFRQGAVVCISGQQVGVLGGPLYSVLKAVSALQMAEELSAQGIAAVPVFWLATEDHDLAEIASVTIPNGCELEKLTAADAEWDGCSGGFDCTGCANRSDGGAGDGSAGAGVGERSATRELSRGRELWLGICAALYADTGRNRDGAGRSAGR